MDTGFRRYGGEFLALRGIQAREWVNNVLCARIVLMLAG
jgi:hypothetical protein